MENLPNFETIIDHAVDFLLRFVKTCWRVLAAGPLSDELDGSDESGKTYVRPSTFSVLTSLCAASTWEIVPWISSPDFHPGTHLSNFASPARIALMAIPWTIISLSFPRMLWRLMPLRYTPALGTMSRLTYAFGAIPLLFLGYILLMALNSNASETIWTNLHYMALGIFSIWIATMIIGSCDSAFRIQSRERNLNLARSLVPPVTIVYVVVGVALGVGMALLDISDIHALNSPYRTIVLEVAQDSVDEYRIDFLLETFVDGYDSIAAPYVRVALTNSYGQGDRQRALRLSVGFTDVPVLSISGPGRNILSVWVPAKWMDAHRQEQLQVILPYYAGNGTMVAEPYVWTGKFVNLVKPAQVKGK